MTKREKALRDFVKRKRDELAASQRKRAAEYLLAAHALRDRPGQEEFMLIADGNDLNPKMIVRWQAFLAHMKRTKNPVFAAWHRLAELKDDDFTQKAPAIAAECGIRETPKSMSAL